MFCYLFEVLFGKRYGLGLHTKDDTPENMVQLLKVCLALGKTANIGTQH